MSKQTLQQKIQRVLARFTPRRIAIIMLGTAILSFGIHNIHQRTAITEGGIIGLVLLINHWLGVPASVFSPLKTLSKFLIVLAMSAIGLNTNIVKLIRTGGKPLGLGFCCWVGIAGMSLLMQHILGLW